MQKFLDFVKDAEKTAVYPRQKASFYLPLKLAGEYGEYHEKLLDFKGDYEPLLKELGDICWYCAMIHHEFFGRQEIPLRKGRVDLLSAVCRVSEWFGKMHRGDGNVDWDILLGHLADVINGIHVEAQALGGSIDQCMNLCRKKLASRAERGVLKGSGDDR